jgi:hypothetical protein
MPSRWSRRHLVVNVVGPDGVGKTTLTEQLVELGGGPRHVLVVANRAGCVPPTVLPRRRPAPPSPTGAATVRPAYPRWLAAGKALYLYVGYQLGWGLRLLPHARNRGMVVIERGWWDLVADAPRYRLTHAHRLVRGLGLLLPRPDVVLVLDAPAPVVRSRKDQLGDEVIEQHRQTWRDLRTGTSKVFLDATAAPVDVLDGARAAVSEAARRRGRHVALSPVRRRTPSDRTDVLLPLLRRLSSDVPSLVVWKNADRTLAGEGDLDVLCAPEHGGALEHAFRAWAAEPGLDPVVSCDHSGTGRYLFAQGLDGAFVELDAKWRVTVRGAVVLRAEAVPGGLVEQDSRGFRRLRPGAEGLLKLAANGIRRDGRPRQHRIDHERVVELLRADPDGVRAASELFWPVAGTVLHAAEQMTVGTWDRGRWTLVQVAMAVRALRHPAALGARVLPGRPGACHGLKPLVTAGLVHPADAEWHRLLPAGHAVRLKETA